MKAFQYSRNVTAPDTLIVCAKPDNFASVFVAKRGWYPVRLDDAKLPRIRWVAVYLTQPVRAITHRAKVKSISKYEDSGKYRIDFDGEPEPLAKPLEPGAIGNIQGQRYTTMEKLMAAASIADLRPWD